MTKLLFFLFITASNLVNSQSNNSFKKLIDNTNNYLSYYSNLNPYTDYYSLKTFNFSKEEHLALLEEANYDATLTPNKDSIASYHIIQYFQDKIIKNIHQITSHKQFDNKDIKALLHCNDVDLLIVVSNDKKLYNFSLDEKTGSTYRSRISIMHYTDFNSSTTEDPYALFSGDGFNNIYAIKTKEGTKYVLTSNVKGCTYCFETSALLVRPEKGGFVQDFKHAMTSRSWEGGVSYNPEKKQIIVDYIPDDLTTSCYCDDEVKLATSNNEPPNIEKRCRCIFDFNGVNFELSKENSNKAERKH